MKINNIPVVLAIRRDDCDGLKMWCHFCKKWHLHGIGEGHRIAHCSSISSPYLKTGYILALNPEEYVSKMKHV